MYAHSLFWILHVIDLYSVRIVMGRLELFHELYVPFVSLSISSHFPYPMLFHLAEVTTSHVFSDVSVDGS